MNAAAPATRILWWRRRVAWLALAIFFYGAGYGLWYVGTPLGRAPQLDGRENLELARQIAAGTLPHEPFYRALLYPLLLAAPLWLGLPVAALPALATAFGLIGHFIIAAAVGLCAARLWPGPSARAAGMVAAALWGFNPVALFYAVDVSDTIPALMFFVLGVYLWLDKRTNLGPALLGGVSIGLATAMRPHYLTITLAAPIARAWLANRWRPQWSDFAAWAGVALPLVVLGLVQQVWSGEFRILPLQGGYNFYSANRPGANGRYFSQQMFFLEIAPGENPARKESDVLFKLAVQKEGISDPPDVYWRKQGWQTIEDHPVDWLKLMLKKAYYLFNDFDQYNNKTFAWHQAQSPWLRWNFLGWGVLFVFAAGIFPLTWLRAASLDAAPGRASLAGLVLVFAVYAAGTLLFFASGRFRLPLAPLLCILCGGWAALPGIFSGGRKGIFIAIVAVACAAFITFSDFFNARDTSTYIQDEMLSANAAADVGEDAEAYRLAGAVLARDPERPDAQRIAAVSYFNLAQAGEKDFDTFDGWAKIAVRFKSSPPRDATLQFVNGVAWWRIGQPDSALQTWQAGAEIYGADSMPAKAFVAANSIRGAMPAGAPPPNAPLVEFLKRPPLTGAMPAGLPSAPRTSSAGSVTRP